MIRAKFFPLVLAVALLAGCATNPHQSLPVRMGTVIETQEGLRPEFQPSTGGAVAGAVVGGAVGNQIGKGNGRTAATVLGAVGGGYAGHQIEKRTRTQTTYQVRVRMEDGSSRVFTRAQPPAVGTPVVLQGKGFRVADERAMPQAQQPQPQYQTVSQPGYVAMQQ